MKRRLIGSICAVLVCMLAVSLPAAAALLDTVGLEENGEKVEVSVRLADETEDEILSLTLSLQIDVTKGDGQGAEAAFEFESGISSSVKEYRYDPSSGILTLYLSGRENLFKEQELTLGEVGLRVSGSEILTANVTLVEDSMSLLNGAFDEVGEGGIAENAATIVIGKEAPEEPPTESPEPPPAVQPPQPPAPGGDSSGNEEEIPTTVQDSTLAPVKIKKPAAAGTSAQRETSRPEETSVTEESIHTTSPETETGSSEESSSEETKEDSGFVTDSQTPAASEGISIFAIILIAAIVLLAGAALIFIQVDRQRRARQRRMRRLAARQRVRESHQSGSGIPKGPGLQNNHSSSLDKKPPRP